MDSKEEFDSASRFLSTDEEEVWKHIDNYPYIVSNLGRVRKIKKPYIGLLCFRTRNRIYKAELRNDKGTKLIAVKQLVADHFIPPFGKGKIVHKNFNWRDCRASNLKRIETGLDRNAKLTPDDREAIIGALLESGAPRGFQTFLARKYCVRRSTINNIWINYKKTHKKETTLCNTEK